MPRMDGTLSTRDALEMKRAAERALAKRGQSSAKYIKKRKSTKFNACIVVSRPGLVGVLEVLPAALNLRTLGYRVSVRCDVWLHDIFECVDYCEPDLGRHYFDKIFDATRAWKTATTAEQTVWRKFIYARFGEHWGKFGKLIFSRLPNPRISTGEYCFVFGESAYKNVGFQLRYLPWLIAHSKELEFAEPKGSDCAALIIAATRELK